MLPAGKISRLSDFVLFFISASMYYCLSEWTGAIPAEYFSAQKRAGYTTYQQTTSIIFPWFVKDAPAADESLQGAFDKLRDTAKASKAARSKSPAVVKRGRSKTPTKAPTAEKKKSTSRSKTPVKKSTPVKDTPAKRKTQVKAKASPSPARTRSARKAAKK